MAASADTQNSAATSVASGLVNATAIRFVGGIKAGDLQQVNALLAADTGLSISGLPQVGNAAAPFANAGAFVSGTSYNAAALTTTAAPAAGAPTIAEWTRSGTPGDSVVLTGANLGNNLHVFVYGQQANGDAVLAEASVVTSEAGDAVVTLPSSLPAGGVYTLWASNSAGFGTGVLLNAPEVWWIGSDEAAPGAVTSVFGRNLTLPGGASPSVVLEMVDGAQAGRTIPLTVVKSASYRVDVRLPTDLPDGHYKIFLNNNGGGATSWSETQGADLQVRAAVGHDWAGSDHAVINASTFGAVPGDGRDDATGLQAAVAAARTMIASGGPIHEVTIQLAAGTYDLAQSLTLEDGIDLEGAGVGKTIIEPTAAFAKTAHTFMLWAGASTTVASATGSRIANLTVTTNGGKDYTAIWGRSSNHLTVQNVDIEAINGEPFDAHDSAHFTLANSRIVGESSFIGSARQVTIDGNAFYGTNQSGENITGFGASGVALTNNTAQNLDATPTASTWQTDTYAGRFYVDQTHYGQPVNQYIAGNITSDLGPYVEYANQGVDTNAGEQILFEGAGETTRFALSNGLLRASTATSLTLSHAVTTALDIGRGALLTVASGTGAGATTEITGYDTATATFQFADPLAVPLDATSTVIISRAPNQIAVVGNTLDGRAQDIAPGVVTASTGVEVYPGGARFAIDGNSFSDLSQAVNLWSFPATKDDPGLGGDNSLVGVNFFDIKNNTVTNTRVGVNFEQDPGGASDLGQPASIVDAHQTIGTTIRNNNLSGATVTSLGFNTRQATPVDIAAANVASGNTLSPSGTVGGLGFDGGSPNLVILNGQAASLAQRVQIAEGLKIANVARYFGTTAEPAFQATLGGDGSIQLDQVRAVAGTVSGQAALVATAGAGDDIGFTSDSTDSRLQVLHGGNGNDVLLGSASANVLAGDAGDDILVAGTGTTQMTGGAGADTFVLEPGAAPRAATITDFAATQGDRIVIDATLPAGADPTAGGYLRLAADSGGTAVMFDADGGGNSFVRLAEVVGAVSAANVAIGLGASASTPTVPAPSTPTVPVASTPVVTTPVVTAPVVVPPVATAPVVTTPVATPPVTSASTPTPTLPGPSVPIVTGPAPAAAGPDILVLNLSEDAYKGNARFTVSVDGVQVGGKQTVTAQHSSGQTQAFMLTGTFDPGAHTVGIAFTNDLYGGTTAKDRNLYVKSIGLDGKTTMENAAQMSEGVTTYAVTAGNAVGSPTLTVPSGATLILDKTAAAGEALTLSGANAVVQFTSAADFHGTIAGFGGGDSLDLRSLGFSATATTLAYSGSATAGTLAVSNGAKAANLSLLGKYAAASFHAAADGQGGTAITFLANRA